MPVPTLNKFGVPLQVGDNIRGGILQPKLKYRFRVLTTNFGPINNQKDLTRQVMNVTKPKLNFEEVQIDSYNSRAWVAGKHTWEMVTLVVRDDITNTVSKLVGHQMQKQLNHFEQTAPAAGVNYKFVMRLQTLDGGNLGPVGSDCQSDTGGNHLPVQEHGACTANTHAASLFSPGQPQVVSQAVHQQPMGRDVKLVFFAVDLQMNRLIHTHTPFYL